ncbi:hypothetical protein E2C01_102727 [Portunus trituberculatus]|uniref:Uncharacterized protein n=1 Tax=Portunus trituberculatus TaxID=210409 RepID=A0A5B7KPT0_PORTR|nr:hypothetical protein [Portunus trituberculatus]
MNTWVSDAAGRATAAVDAVNGWLNLRVPAGVLGTSTVSYRKGGAPSPPPSAPSLTSARCGDDFTGNLRTK